MNSWNFVSNLGKDAEQRFTANGDSIVSFSAAVKAGYGDKATTTWVRCTMFGKFGNGVFPYLLKGTQVGIVGEASLRPWTGKDGIEKQSLEVRVNDLTLLGSKQGGNAEHQTTQRPSAQQRSAPAARQAVPEFDDDPNQIPF